MIAGIVLAAGQSSRLGRPKQLLPLQGEPLLRHTLRAILASSLDDVLVVVGHEADVVREAIADLPVRVVFNPEFATGQSTSVRAGLDALASDTNAAMFLLGDQPTVDPQVIDSLIDAWQKTKSPVVAPKYRDGIGNPVLFDRAIFPKLTALRGDTGARKIVRAHQQRGRLHVVEITDPAPPDIDTEDDYAALKASLPEFPRITPPSPGSDGRGGQGG